MGDLALLSGCLYINTENTQEHHTIKLILAITNHKKKSINKNNNLPILIFNSNERVIFLNNGENLDYFIAFLLFYFPFSIRSHVSIIHNLKKGNILLKI